MNPGTNYDVEAVRERAARLLERIGEEDGVPFVSPVEPLAPKKKRKRRTPDYRQLKVRVTRKKHINDGTGEFIPGIPYTVGPLVKMVMELKPLRIIGYCIVRSCNAACATKSTRSLWCAAHLSEQRHKSKILGARLRNRRRRRRKEVCKRYELEKRSKKSRRKSR